MTYELHILNNQGRWIPLDLSDETPAMNYQVNTLADLKDRQSGYSQAIKLPRTAGNIRALGFVDVFPASTSVPYTQHPCRLLCAGLDISPKGGAVLYVDSVSKTAINVQVVSSTRSLVEILNDTPLSSEGIGDGDYIAPWDGVAPASASGKWLYTLAVVDKAAQSRQPSVPFDIFTSGYDVPAVDRRYIFPAVPLLETVRRIFAARGYTLSTNLSDYPSAADDYVSATKLVAIDTGGLPDGGASAWGDSVSPPPATAETWNVEWQRNGENPSLVPVIDMDFADPNGTGRLWRGVRFTAPSSGGVFRGKITAGTTRGDLTEKITYVAYRDFQGDTQDKTLVASGVLDGQNALTFDVALEADERLNIGIIAYIRGGGTLGQIDISGWFWLFGSSDNQEVQPGDSIDVLRSLGFSSQGDFVKAFLQTYGLTMDVDESTKTVHVDTFRNWTARASAGSGIDWTDRLVETTEESLSFSISGYAQQNRILLKDNSDDQKTDTAVIRVEDTTLEATKDLFTLPFVAGRNLTGRIGAQTYTLAALSTYEVSEDNENADRYSRDYKGSDAHLLTLSGNPVQVVITGSGSYRTTLYPVVHRAVQSYVDEYYNELQTSVLRRSRVLSARVLLTPLDIFSLDLFRPVYIGLPFGSWFYISKLSNFIAGKPCQVEMVAMRLPAVAPQPTPSDPPQPPTYSLSASVAPGQASYGSATVVPVSVTSGGSATWSAIPSPSYRFSRWVFSDGKTFSTAAITRSGIASALSALAYFEYAGPIPVSFTARAMGKNGYWGVQFSAVPDVLEQGISVQVDCTLELSDHDTRVIQSAIPLDGWIPTAKPYDETAGITADALSGTITIDPSTGYSVGTVSWLTE